MELREVTYLAIALRILVAAVLGGVMGLERGMKNRAAGLRTYMLVCIGACLIMLTNQFIYQTSQAGDPVRMGAQVISGIGFLGAGTIIVTRRSQIKGLTTAAGLWASAGVGLALGIGFYEGAITGALAVVLAMTALQKMDNRMHSKAKSMDVYIELNKQLSLGDLMRQIRELEIDISDVQKEMVTDSDNNIRAYTATLKTQKRTPHVEVLEKLLAIEGVIYAETLT